MNSSEIHFPEFSLRKGIGLHQYLFRYACLCAEEEIEPETTKCWIAECTQSLNYYRDVPAREICAAVEHAYACVFNSEPIVRREVSRYEPDAAANIAEDYGTTVEQLVELSPCRPPVHPAEALAALFAKDEFTCLASKLDRAKTLPLSVWLELEDELYGYQFVVPHPMTSKMGETKGAGKQSPRTVSNTGQRRRIVCDFDKPKPSIQPSLIAYLSEYCGLDPELVLTSGGKSLHAWWRVDDWPLEDIDFFEDEAIRVGADPALMSEARKCQLVRLPAGIRDNGNKQRILFWNPSPIEK